MSTPEDTGVIPVNPVLDGELLNDHRSHGQREQCRRVAVWWQRCPHVPPALKSRAHLMRTIKDAAVTISGGTVWPPSNSR